MDIKSMLNKAKRLERGYLGVIAQALRENKAEVLEMQKSQLLSGVDSEEKPLRPTYDQDPFFKTDEGRKKYIKLKQETQSKHDQLRKYNIFGNKDSLTPNLIVTGSYHKGLRTEVSKGTITIIGTWSRSPNIERKYPTALGLTSIGFGVLFERYAKPDLIDYFNNS